MMRATAIGMTKQSLGGRARAAAMTPEERKASAQRAAEQRWRGVGQYVYVIGPEVGPQKIGIATKPALRLHDIQNGNPAHLSIALQMDPEERSAIEVERRAHLILDASRLRGEWFDVTRERAVEAVHTALAELRSGEARVPFEATVPLTFRLRQSVLTRIRAEHGAKWRKAVERLVSTATPDTIARARAAAARGGDVVPPVRAVIEAMVEGHYAEAPASPARASGRRRQTRLSAQGRVESALAASLALRQLLQPDQQEFLGRVSSGEEPDMGFTRSASLGDPESAALALADDVGAQTAFHGFAQGLDALRCGHRRLALSNARSGTNCPRPSSPPDRCRTRSDPRWSASAP
jgi:hypothetical protein